MKIKNQLTLQRLVGKIDNDFNISESDWIPRVAAWTIDALAQMKVLPMERKKRELEVSERIAIYPCEINGKEFKVFDKCGKEIPYLDKVRKSKCSDIEGKNSISEISVFNGQENCLKSSRIVDDEKCVNGRNYVLSGNNIELNFDTDKIITESYEVATYHDDYYDCECPYIYDNGLLLEALAWYCMFKYLSRGSKHPVYDLKSNSPVTNPYIQWNNLKVKAANSVKIDISREDSGWNNFFYNSTFLPRS